MADLTVKERMAIERVEMPAQDSAKRVSNFAEVNLGLAAEVAIQEAKRCIGCKKRPCVAGCPVGVRIPEMLDAIASGDFKKAAEIVRVDDALPATTGRVCPQETQCVRAGQEGQAGRYRLARALRR
jgi:glutamate synthase (NADPH/NADH) small chain